MLAFGTVNCESSSEYRIHRTSKPQMDSINPMSTPVFMDLIVQKTKTEKAAKDSYLAGENYKFPGNNAPLQP